MFRRRVLVIALAAAAAQGAQSQVIEEVIVTAQKRAEDVMDVPIAITAFSGTALEEIGARSLTDVGRFTAGVDMNNEKSLQPTYTIRGIETADWTIGSDPAVAVYVDGVYAARGAGAEAALIDIDRIEVLKGPQGTLFGRNATGGAIHIVTPKPSQELEGRVKLTAGNYERTDAEMVLNGGLSDTVAVRAVASLRKRDGYLNNLNGPDLNDEDQKNFRVAVLWQASDATEVLLRAGYEDMNQKSAVLHTLNAAAWEQANPGFTHDPFGDVAFDHPQLEAREMANASLEINHDVGGMTFTSISAWRDFDTKLDEDLDGSNNPDFYFGSRNPETSEFWSQEFRLSGETDALKWTLGATYSYEDIAHTIQADFLFTTFESFALLSGGVAPEQIPAVRQLQRAGILLTDVTGDGVPDQVPCSALLGFPIDNCDGIATATFIDQLTGGAFGLPTLLPAVLPRVAAGYADPWTEIVENEGEYESYALYGDATWALNERTNLSLGLRYTYDDKQFYLFTAWTNQLLPGVPFGLAFYNNGVPLIDVTQNEDWDNLSGRIVLDYALSDMVMGYASVATGFKSGGFNSQNFGPDIDTAYDAEEVINYELGLKGRALDNTLQFSMALFFYEYENLQTLELFGEPIPGYYLRNADADGTGYELEVAWLVNDNWTFAGNYSWLDTEFTDYNIIEAAGETEADDLTGEARAETPEHKVNLSLEYTRGLGDLGEVSSRLDYTWTDDRINVTRGEVEAYDLLNARIGFISGDGAWELALWSANLTDEEVLTNFGNGEAVGSTPGWRIVPRTWGIDVGYNF